MGSELSFEPLIGAQPNNSTGEVGQGRKASLDAANTTEGLALDHTSDHTHTVRSHEGLQASLQPLGIFGAGDGI